MVNLETGSYAPKQDAQKEKKENNFENSLKENEKDKTSFEFNFENAEEFIENNFTRTEKEEEKEGVKYKLIEFRPNNEEIKKFVKDSQFYLFGGSGQASNRNYHGIEKSKSEEEYNKWWLADIKTMQEMVENDFDGLVVRTEKSLAMIDGFIKSIGKESLADYYSSALYGEGNALYAKEMMEKGEDAESKTIEFLNKKKGLCLNSQLSPYNPYISTLFLRKDISEMEEYKNIFAEKYKDLGETGGKGEIKFEKLIVDNKHLKNNLMENDLPVDQRRKLHKLIYAQVYDLSVPVKEWYDDFSKKIEHEELIAQENTRLFSLMKFKDKNLYSGSAGIGWDVPAVGKIKDITDFAMVTGKEFYEEGVVRFMVIEH